MPASKIIPFGSDLRITKTTRRAAGAGTWVIGTVHGHRFDALVFPEHALNADFELGESRISKLFIKSTTSNLSVVEFDRGWSIRPKNEVAARIAEFLQATLADRIWGSTHLASR